MRNVLAASGITTAYATAALSFVRTTSAMTLRALTMVLSICNLAPSIQPPALKPILTNQTTTNLDAMFRTCSNNKVSFSTKIADTPVYIPCVAADGWRMPACRVEEWANQADQEARRRGISLTNYRHIIYILPKGDPCGFGGLGTIGPACAQAESKGNPPCRVWISGSIPTQLPAYFHELGHNLGLMHASANNDQYGDLTDTMGYCCNMRCFAAPNTFRLKWTTPLTTIVMPIRQHEDIKLQRSQYIIIKDFARRENTFVQFRVAKSNAYEKNIDFTSVNIYQAAQAEYVPSVYVAMLWKQRDSTAGNFIWNNYYSVKITLLDISDKFAHIRVSAPSMMVMFLDANRVPL